ncbi:MAG: hypothetical protein OQK79_09960 [Rhodanobacter sp.]|nr:hypothetical protein [Rhodanobacter sp.]
MSGYALIQALVIGVVVMFSAWRAFRKLLPQTSRRMIAGVSTRLDRPERSVRVRRLGRWLQPAEAKSGDCGSGDGCSSCGSCTPARPPADAKPPAEGGEPRPLDFRPRR